MNSARGMLTSSNVLSSSNMTDLHKHSLSPMVSITINPLEPKKHNKW